jgi:hypothetical protein
MSYTLFSLPGELRNKVYRLALSEAAGLDYIQESPASGKLCLHEPHVKSEIIESNTAGQPVDDATVPPSEQAPKHTPGRTRVIANQLQFVCRQLRSETKHLEVLYNSITLTTPQSTTFSLFMSSLPPFFREHQHVFHLKARMSQWERKMFSGLSNFCRTYPRCTLNFHHPKLRSSTPLSIIFTALLVKHGARKDTTFVTKVTSNHALQQKILDLLPSQIEHQLVALIPPNIIIFPYDNFEEATFRKACGENEVIRELLAPTLKGGIDDLVVIVKDCYMEGF